MERVIIIEGIPGSGKDTLQRQLSDKYKKKGFTVYPYLEEELLWSWKHAWINNISTLRVEFMENFLDLIEEKIKDTTSLFILNRFHISFAVLTQGHEKEIDRRYGKILERLRNLPTKVIVTILDEKEIEERTSHRERDEIWKQHQTEIMKKYGFTNTLDLYSEEQKKIFKTLEKQEIPFEKIRVEI